MVWPLNRVYVARLGVLGFGRRRLWIFRKHPFQGSVAFSRAFYPRLAGGNSNFPKPSAILLQPHQTTGIWAFLGSGGAPRLVSSFLAFLSCLGWWDVGSVGFGLGKVFRTSLGIVSCISSSRSPETVKKARNSQLKLQEFRSWGNEG